MRFIHTADWHLGNQMHDIDRSAETASFLRWLSDQIFEQHADALIVSGDIFDTVNPSVESRKQYFDFLADFVKRGLRNIVVVGGNHDSAIMLDASKELLGLSHIHVVGSISTAGADELVFELTGSDGEPCAVCMALPFVREVELRGRLSKTVPDSDLYAQGYAALYSEALEKAEALRAGRAIPLIATGHLYAAQLDGRLAASSAKGVFEAGDDGVKKLDVLGNLGAVPPSVFPEQIDYVALGHIHYATMVAKNPRVRYSGSPFVLGFDEATVPRTVLSVELSGDAPAVETLQVPAATVYRRVSGTLSEVRDALEKLATSHAALERDRRKPLVLEICYQKEPGVSASDYLEEAIAALPADVTVASWKLLSSFQAESTGFGEVEAQEIASFSDEEIFTRLIEARLADDGFASDSEETKAALDACLPLFTRIAAEL